MYKLYPILTMAAIISVFATVFIIAYATMKDKKEAIGFDRNMKDSEIMKRLLKYAKPYTHRFIFVFVLMIISIAHEIISPLILGNVIETLGSSEGFELSYLYGAIICYALILLVSLISSYIQSIILQRTGQRIVANIREELYDHIQSLSHCQLTKIPVGTLVTRVTNDTNSISITFTNIIVNLIKNCFIIIGVLAAMLLLNYMLTLMVLCFVPFVVIFAFVFRVFSRRAHRKVKRELQTSTSSSLKIFRE
jgi:ATP-binding cassette subfamily B protein